MEVLLERLVAVVVFFEDATLLAGFVFGFVFDVDDFTVLADLFAATVFFGALDVEDDFGLAEAPFDFVFDDAPVVELFAVDARDFELDRFLVVGICFSSSLSN